MGWTYQHAEHYKNGKIDRRAECDSYFMEGLNAGHYEILKSRMIGTVYYAAIRNVDRYAGKDEKGNSIYEPVPEGNYFESS